MNNSLLLQQIFQICIIPLLSILTAYLVQYIKCQMDTIKEKTNNETAKKYGDMITQTITDCVIATNQTYVDSLKGKNAFDKEAQLTAFTQTKNTILNILSEESKQYISESFGDLETYLNTQIEAIVSKLKI